MPDDLETPVTLTIYTRHPWDYELINHETGERYVGGADGHWKAKPVPDPDL